jgi:hypothetical protein
MVEKHSRKALKILSHIDASAIGMQDYTIQVRASSLGELLEDADNGEPARLLWERIGNADVDEAPPTIGEEFFYLVGLRRQGEGQAKVEDVIIYRCVTAKGIWL